MPIFPEVMRGIRIAIYIDNSSRAPLGRKAKGPEESINHIARACHSAITG
jgi:hypothetical protein